jgi:ATP-dependent RNA helicase MSS116, mitochondrial
MQQQQSDGFGDEDAGDEYVDDHSSSDATAVDATGFDPNAPPTKKFQDMKSVLTYDIYKALVEKPFQFTHMSPVQEAVISLISDGLSTPRLPTAEEVTRAMEKGSENRGEWDNDSSRRYKLPILSVNPPKPDLLVKSKTGTGKTLGFLVPAVESRIATIHAEGKLYEMLHPSAQKSDVGLQMARFSKESVGCLILSPTRELATQIANEAIRLLYHFRTFEVRLIVGGAGRNQQIRDFISGRKDIVVATPGRMIDLLESEEEFRKGLSRAQTLILDEADTLMDMGFKDDIQRIVQYMAPKEKRQTFMFSATFSSQVRDIVRASMNSNPTFIDTVGENDGGVHQHIPQFHTTFDDPKYLIPHLAKLVIQDQLQHPEGGKAIIFLPTTKYTQMVSQIMLSLKPLLPFGKENTKILEMHSKKTQESRSRASGQFRKNLSGIYQILVTSDVSARGVDYPGVTRVIQVGIPATPEMYVHRVGRTGRAGKEGRGDLLLLPFERNYIKQSIGHIPLQPCKVQEVEQDIQRLAEEYDQLPASSKPQFKIPVFTGRNRNANVEQVGTGILPNTAQRLSKVDSFIFDDLIPQIPTEESEEVFTSQLGYYIGKLTDLRIRKDDILEGLKEWCTGAIGMESPPHLGPAFLEKLGFSKEGRPGGDRRRGGFGSGRGLGGRGGGRGFGRGDGNE